MSSGNSNSELRQVVNQTVWTEKSHKDQNKKTSEKNMIQTAMTHLKFKTVMQSDQRRITQPQTQHNIKNLRYCSEL